MKWVYKQQLKIGEKEAILRQLLAERGVKGDKAIKSYLAPDENSFQDPMQLPDIAEAIALIQKAKQENWKVAVYGDYDVDGVTSTYIMWDFLFNQLKIDAVPFIPSRFDSGYGLHENAMQELKDSGVRLIITVDCGVKDAELIKKFTDEKLRFIVTDHHTLPEDEKFSCPVVHPKRKTSKLEFQDISGAATAWKLISAYTQKQKQDGKAQLDNMKYLEFVALASVCDVMPLVNENRAIVKLGLVKMANTENLGLKTLIQMVGLTGVELNAYHLGFVIGPRINAAGRIENALEVVRLFATKSQAKAMQIANELNLLNQNRQKLTTDTLEQAEMQLAELNSDALKARKFIFVYGENWHEGIIGLVAGKLAEKYYRPTIAATIIEGKVTGSARSIKNFDVTAAISTQTTLLTRFGGHSQAAGFSLIPENIQAFKNGLETLAAEQIQDEQLERSIEIDANLDPELVDIELVEELAKLEPFGYGNPRPIFELKGLVVNRLSKFGQKGEHIRLTLMTSNGKMLEAVCFNFANANEHFAELAIGDRIDVASNLDLNKWNGMVKVQIKIIDFISTDNPANKTAHNISS